MRLTILFAIHTCYCTSSLQLYPYCTVGPPTIDFISRNVISYDGKKVSLLCNASNGVDAIEHIRITWYNSEGAIVKSGGRHLLYNTTDKLTGQVQSILLFDPVKYTDSGEYTCRTSNHNESYSEAKTNLTVECT